MSCYSFRRKSRIFKLFQNNRILVSRPMNGVYSSTICAPIAFIWLSGFMLYLNNQVNSKIDGTENRLNSRLNSVESNRRKWVLDSIC